MGHAEKWDRCEISGDPCAAYWRNGKVIAAATIGRDLLSLQIEAAMEAGDQSGIEALLRPM